MSAGATRVPRVGVGIVLLRDDHVLLIKRRNPPKAGQWSLPGGKVEWAEPVLRAAARELLEETGLRWQAAQLLDVVDMIDGEHHYVLVDYVALAAEGEPVAGDDVSDCRFVPLSEIATYGLWSETVRIIELAAEVAAPLKA
ncbi:MAG: NUDIX hydrolase [Geminicoccaceae bacterium]